MIFKLNTSYNKIAHFENVSFDQKLRSFSNFCIVTYIQTTVSNA